MGDLSVISVGPDGINTLADDQVVLNIAVVGDSIREVEQLNAPRLFLAMLKSLAFRLIGR